MQIVAKALALPHIRRITGYLVGNMDKWNDAKKAEEECSRGSNISLDDQGLHFGNDMNL